MTSKTDELVKLLPCPFCGSADIDLSFALAADGVKSPGCMTCGCCGPESKDQSESARVEAWNRRTLQQRSGWLPIESAPRDGKWFLAYRMGVISQCRRQSYAKQEEWGGEGWAYCPFSQPTHWMPLPPAPQPRED